MKKYALFAGLIFGFISFALSNTVNADPPTRVARLSYINGSVSFLPAGVDDWVYATLNYPAVTGDHFWTDNDSRAELQIGPGMVRLGARTDLTILNLDDSIAQFRLDQGKLKLRLRRLLPNQVVEVDTPNLAFTITQPGVYRINVDQDGKATVVSVQGGQGNVYGEDGSYVIDEQQSYQFVGTALNDYQQIPLPEHDDFDNWSDERDSLSNNPVSVNYVSPDTIGYEDLDSYGDWSVDDTYGNVWSPSSVGTDWVPYHSGHWVWIGAWGWTWIDEQPWGFAPFHYGRWVTLHGRWSWVPGPIHSAPVYAPALVAFLGHGALQLSAGGPEGIAWFPLGPGDVYIPPYSVGQDYFRNINVSNTRIDAAFLTNAYHNQDQRFTYRNRQVANAITAVPTSAFVGSQNVARSAVKVSSSQLANAPVTPVAAVTPTRTSVLGTAAKAKSTPPAANLTRGIVAKTTPPPAPLSFTAKQAQLAKTPGRPLSASELKTLSSKTPAVTARPAVKVVTPRKPITPTRKIAPTQPTGVHIKPGAPSRVQPAVPQPSRTQPEERTRRPSAAPQPSRIQPEERMQRRPSAAPQPSRTQPEERMQRRPSEVQQPSRIEREDRMQRRPSEAPQPSRIEREERMQRRPSEAPQPSRIEPEERMQRRPSEVQQPSRIEREERLQRRPSEVQQPSRIEREERLQRRPSEVQQPSRIEREERMQRRPSEEAPQPSRIQPEERVYRPSTVPQPSRIQPEQRMERPEMVPHQERMQEMERMQRPSRGLHPDR